MRQLDEAYPEYHLPSFNQDFGHLVTAQPRGYGEFLYGSIRLRPLSGFEAQGAGTCLSFPFPGATRHLSADDGETIEGNVSLDLEPPLVVQRPLNSIHEPVDEPEGSAQNKPSTESSEISPNASAGVRT